MLVLSRGVGETILVGNDIEIVVCDIRGDKMRLGITAPRDVQIHRREVYDAIHGKEPESLEQPSLLKHTPSFSTGETSYDTNSET